MNFFSFNLYPCANIFCTSPPPPPPPHKFSNGPSLNLHILGGGLKVRLYFYNLAVHNMLNDKIPNSQLDS